jgi:hypothetical protein
MVTSTSAFFASGVASGFLAVTAATGAAFSASADESVADAKAAGHRVAP